MARQADGIFRSARLLLKTAILILFFCCQLWGLDPDKPGNQYLVDQWEIADGIPSNEVRSIAQTPDGYLWIATSKGLVRFDGLKFSTIPFIGEGTIDPEKTTIPDTLFVDKQGTLWIGSSAGLTSYKHQTRQFKTFTTAQGITKDRIRRIKDDIRGNLWISFFTSYLNRFSNGKITAFDASHGLEGKRINAIIEDRNGNLLFGSRENGVFTFREEKFFKYPIEGLDNVQINIMHEDRKGDLWIGTNNGLFRVTGKGTERYTARDGLSDDHVTYVTEDSDRNIWAGTSKGLDRIKKKDNGTIAVETVLRHLTVFYLFEDREKSLWVGTFASGIRRLKDSKFISYIPLEEHREEIFFSLFQDRQGDTWIGTLEGKLLRFRDNEFIQSLEIPGISGTAITAIAEDARGNLWLGTNGKGVFQRKDKTVIRFTTRDGLADNLVRSISTDSRGNLWFSTFDGVSRYNNGVIESLKSRQGLSGKIVYNVYEDNAHHIRIAADKGITLLKDGKIARENMVYYLPDISVTCIYEDPDVPEGGNSVYWTATHGAGLKRLEKDTVISYTTAQGMVTNFIYQFFEDQRGHFWLMSDSGILRVSKEELNAFATGGISSGEKINCISFGISDGLKSLEFMDGFSRHSALKTRNGEFWFLTNKGISIMNPDKIPLNKFPPPVVIETVLFNQQSVPLHPDADGFKGITEFLFYFTAPTFLSPGKIRFKYQLEGIDHDWIFLPAGSERVARYKDLEPGAYTFKVIACNSEGVWNRTGVSMSFTLKPLFYQTLLFKAAILLILILLVAAAFYLYKKRLFKKKSKYKSSPLNDQFAAECIKKLNTLMEVEKIYCDENLSLQSLAEKLSISHHMLSQILNEKLNRNFSDFVNFYRIEEAKRIFQSVKGSEKKITAVAFEVGFNTMVAFYNAFKKYTNMTPAQYKKKFGKK